MYLNFNRMVFTIVWGRECGGTDLLWGDALEDAINYPLYHVLLMDSPASLVNIQLVVLHRRI